MEGFWFSCLNRFEKELPAQQFNTWIRPLKIDLAAASSGEVRVLAPNRFGLQWVKERFAARIEAMGAQYFAVPVRVTLLLDPVPMPAPAAEPAATAPVNSKPRVPLANGARPVANEQRSSLIPEFSFESFVTGKANQLARAAALQVADHPGTSYNPLFIYGGVGLGKTHLIHAVGNHVHAHQPRVKVRYLHAAQ